MRFLANDGMEVIFQDLNELQAFLQQEIYDRVIFEMLERTEDAFFADSHLVSYVSATSVSVQPGVGFQTDSSVDASEPTKRMLYRSAVATLNLQAPDSVNDRIDIVVAKAQLVNGTPETRKFKNAGDLTVSDESFVTDVDWQTDLQIVAGTPAGSPSEPAVPAGYIKIATLTVNAVAGLSGAGDVADNRNLMPTGANAPINTLAFNRLTQQAALAIQTAFEEIDALLVNGKLTTNIFEDSVSDPAAPPTDKDRVIYNKDGTLFVRESDPEGGAILPLGSGAGGGGGSKWEGDALAPIEAFENGYPVFKYGQPGENQELYLFLRVPSGYLPGRQIKAFLPMYSPSTADEYKFEIQSTLIRVGQDGLDDNSNQQTSNLNVANTATANELKSLEFALTSATGQINGFSVSPNDIIKLRLKRISADGSEDSGDVRLIQSGTEVTFA